MNDGGEWTGPRPAAAPVPAGWRLEADAGLRVLDGGAVLLGGVPLRLFRVGPAAARHVASWLRGAGVADRPGARRLARRLLDAGLVHPAPSRGGPAPADVTIVVPARDRPQALAACLAALPRSVPVVVVDDASHDPAAIDRAAAAAGARLVRREVNGGPGAARNTGLAACDTPFLAFVDSDCVPPPGWLERLLPHFGDPAVGAVAPRIVALAAGGGKSRLAAYERARSPLDMGPREAAARPGGSVPYVPATAIVARRGALGDGFDERLRVGEDVDLCWRLVASGWTVRYDPGVRVAHAHRSAPSDWLRTRVRYNAAAGTLARRHPGALRAVYVSRWNAVAWAAVVLRRPPVVLGSLVLQYALLRRQLAAQIAEPDGDAVRIVAAGVVRDGAALAGALRGPWLPLSLVLGGARQRSRRLLALVHVVAPLLEWAAVRPPVGPATYVAARGLDDAARGLGTWVGCVRRRSPEPLLPALGARSPRPRLTRRLVA